LADVISIVKHAAMVQSPPQDLAAEAVTELEAVVDDLREIITLLEKEEGVEK
jgi:hypothetical protein